MNEIQITLFDTEKAKEESIKMENKNQFKRDRFVLEYLLLMANGEDNATKAAINAGYSKKTAKQQAYRFKKDPQVLKAIENEQKRLSQSLKIDSEFLAKETLEMLKVAKGEKGRINQSIEEVKNKQGKKEKKVVETLLKNYSGGEIKSAIEILGKLTGSFTENKNVSHEFEIEDLKKTQSAGLGALLDEVE